MVPFFYFQEFQRYLQSEKRYSAHTVDAYLSDVNEFSGFLTSEGITADLKEVSASDIKAWMMHLLENEISSRSVARKLSSLRCYFKLLCTHEEISDNPCLRLKAPIQKKRLPKVFSPGEVKQVLDGFSAQHDFSSLRDAVLIEMLYGTGIRISELMGLRLLDVNGNEIRVFGKRGKERIVPMHTRLSHLLGQYLAERNRLFLSSGIEPLMLLDNGKKMYPKFVFRKINFYFGAVSMAKTRSPHMLRHSFATHMLNMGADLNGIKEVLGHSSLQSTQVYTHYAFERLSQIHKQSHPRGDKNRR